MARLGRRGRPPHGAARVPHPRLGRQRGPSTGHHTAVERRRIRRSRRFVPVNIAANCHVPPRGPACQGRSRRLRRDPATTRRITGNRPLPPPLASPRPLVYRTCREPRSRRAVGLPERVLVGRRSNTALPDRRRRRRPTRHLRGDPGLQLMCRPRPGRRCRSSLASSRDRLRSAHGYGGSRPAQRRPRRGRSRWTTRTPRSRGPTPARRSRRHDARPEPAGTATLGLATGIRTFQESPSPRTSRD
jgi:hypothetical protein